MNAFLSNYDSEGKRKYLTKDETEKFLLAAEKEDISVYMFCYVVAKTGCRISEALMISGGNIDFDTGIVVLECLKKRRGGVFRAVPLSPKLLAKLSEWISSAAFKEDERLWPWSRMTGYRRITDVMKKAGVHGPWATPKGLRHAFGVRAVQSGVPINLVQRWLGHSDMKTTAIYANALGTEERDLASRTWMSEVKVRKPPPRKGPAIRRRRRIKNDDIGHGFIKFDRRLAVRKLKFYKNLFKSKPVPIYVVVVVALMVELFSEIRIISVM